MVEKFVRDISKTIYPQLYHEFQLKSDSSEETSNFIVEDLPENKFNAVIEFLIANYKKSEDFGVKFNDKDSDGNEKHLRIFYREILDRKLSLVCTKMGSRDIIAVNLMLVKSRGVNDDISKADDSELHDVDHLLQCVCLVIHPDYKNSENFIKEIIKSQLTFIAVLDDVKLMTTEIPKDFDCEESLKESFPNFTYDFSNSCGLISKLD